MKEVLTFLTACAVLAIANAFTTALAIALLFAALLGAITFPRQTFGLAFVLGLIALAIKEPLACIVALAVVITASTVGSRFHMRRAKRPLLLPAPRER